MDIPAGALLSAPKRFVSHVGLYLGNGLIFHNNPEKGEHISSIDEFSWGQPVRIMRILTGQELLGALQRASQILSAPKRYDALTNNCEHTLSRALGKAQSSPQLQSIGVISLFFISLAYLASRK